MRLQRVLVRKTGGRVADWRVPVLADAGLRRRLVAARRNDNNLRYMDDTTLKAGNEEKLRSLLMMVKEESEKAALKLNIKKVKIMASGPITSRQTDGGKVETVTDFISSGSKITEDGDCNHKIKRCLLLGRKAMTNLDRIWFFQLSCKDIRVGP